MQLPTHFRRWVADGPARSFEAAARLRTFPLKLPNSDEVLVRTLYATVNGGHDSFVACREARWKSVTGTMNLGADGLGQIVALGSDVTSLSIGDYVSCGFCSSFSEYTTPAAKDCIVLKSPTPEYAALRVSGNLACGCLENVARIEEGKTIMITAACGGFGHLAVQIAKLNGCHVIGTCRGDVKKAKVYDLGADRVIDYTKESIDDVLSEEYPSGIDYVLDGVGGEIWRIALDHLIPNGKLLCVGYISRYPHQAIEDSKLNEELPAGVSIPDLFWTQTNTAIGDKQVITRIWPSDPAEIVRCRQRAFDLFDQKKLKVVIDQYSLQTFVGIENVVNATNYMLSGENVGKVLIQL